jgi:ABC-type sugar transport system ATPase subunit
VSALALRGVSKRFGRVVAVRDVSLEVADSEVCVLLGPSGCGKSTLLRVVAGLEAPDAGVVQLREADVTGREPRERDIAMVFQHYALYPHLTVRQNLAFPLRARRVPREEIPGRVGDAARLLHIEELLDRTPRELSGGQRQRVAIGRAIVRRPALFLFDEPLSNLDAQLRARMRVELAELFRQLGTAVLYVTHDQVEAMTLGDRIVLMREGGIEQAGTPAELYDTPATVFAATFIGTPPMNVIAVGGAGAPAAPEGTPPGAARIGVRPEDLRIAPDGAWQGRVELVENLGAEALVYVRVGAHRLVVRETGRTGASPGDEIGLTPQRVHSFDEQGRRLSA